MNPETGPRTAIIILNWNGWEDTIECLESCLQLTDAAYRIIVCDNGSNDGSLEKIADWAAGRPVASGAAAPARNPITVDHAHADRPSEAGFDAAPLLTLLPTGGNLGFAGGNNVGLRHAAAWGADFAWFLNNDTIVAPDALTALVARASQSARIGMCGSTIAYYDQPDRLQLAGGGAYYPWIGMARLIAAHTPADAPPTEDVVEAQMAFVSGASCLVDMDFYRDIGGMEERYFLYCEEIDWAWRARGRWKLGYARDSVVYHKAGRSAGSKGAEGGRSASSAYYLWRARRMMTMRYHPWGAPGLVLIGMASVLIALTQGRSGVARAIMAGLMGGAPPKA